jgi:hypothetical protein
VHKARKTKDGAQWKVVTVPTTEDGTALTSRVSALLVVRLRVSDCAARSMTAFVPPAPTDTNTKKEREVHHFDILVCCSGQHQVPRETHKDHPFNQFTGTSCRAQSKAGA